MGKSYTPTIFAKKLAALHVFGQQPAAANVFGQQPAPVSGFGLTYCATSSSHNVFEARGAGLFVPPATASVYDKPVDASADQNIIAAQDAMACIDATIRTLLVSARALQTQVVIELSRLLPSALFHHPHWHPSFPRRTQTRGSMPPTLNYCATCSKRALLCSWSCAVCSCSASPPTCLPPSRCKHPCHRASCSCISPSPQDVLSKSVGMLRQQNDR